MLRLSRQVLFVAVFLITSDLYAADYSVINKAGYQHIFNHSRFLISQDLKKLQSKRDLPANEQMRYIADLFENIPYQYSGAMGEGDWQPTAKTYQGGAVHVDQDPVYQVQGFDCLTLVQTMMSMYYSKNLPEFENNLINIAYGAYDLNRADQVHYFNRNHFTDADFNLVNQQRGYLRDVTSVGPLAVFSKKIQINVSAANWLKLQREDPDKYVRVLDQGNGLAMTSRFMNDYPKLAGKDFKNKSLLISYIPKTALAIRTANGNYVPNQGLFDLIPTPSVVEIVNSPDHWSSGGVKIKDMIGSETSISHLGMAYRQIFKKGDLIYQRIMCDDGAKGYTSCEAKPVYCELSYCRELMFTHATDMYPRRFKWYQYPKGQWQCSADKPPKGIHYTQCDRVETLPLFNYLTNNQYGHYWYMNTPAILGIHIEKLSKTTPGFAVQR